MGSVPISGRTPGLPIVCKGTGDPSPNFWGSGAIVLGGLGPLVAQCGRVKVVHFTPQLYRGVRAELLVHTPLG